jgi:hypothetical protein
MNLTQAVHQRWAATAPLVALLPAERVFTGSSVDPAPPFAVIARESGQPLARFGDGSGIDAARLRIQVFDDCYDRATAIIQQVKLAFDRASFALASGDKVLEIRRHADGEEQQPDARWQMTVEFECIVYLAAGC